MSRACAIAAPDDQAATADLLRAVVAALDPITPADRAVARWAHGAATALNLVAHRSQAMSGE